MPPPGTPVGSSSAAGIPLTGPWVTDQSSHEIVAFSHLGAPGRQNLFTWLNSAWRPIPTRSNPAPDNPDNFSLAWDGAERGVIALGDDEGRETASGGWLFGGNQTWILRRHSTVG